MQEKKKSTEGNKMKKNYALGLIAAFKHPYNFSRFILNKAFSHERIEPPDEKNLLVETPLKRQIIERTC